MVGFIIYWCLILICVLYLAYLIVFRLEHRNEENKPIVFTFKNIIDGFCLGTVIAILVGTFNHDLKQTRAQEIEWKKYCKGDIDFGSEDIFADKANEDTDMTSTQDLRKYRDNIKEKDGVVVYDRGELEFIIICRKNEPKQDTIRFGTSGPTE